MTATALTSAATAAAADNEIQAGPAARKLRARALYEQFQQDGVVTTPLVLEAVQANFYWNKLSADERVRWRTPALTQAEATPIFKASQRVHASVKQFERKVWFRGLQRKIAACQTRGMEGEGNGFTARAYTIAGRCLITLEDQASKQQVTLITADDEKPYERLKMPGLPSRYARHRSRSTPMGAMGVQSYECTFETAMTLLGKARTAFPKLKPCEEVNLGF